MIARSDLPVRSVNKIYIAGPESLLNSDNIGNTKSTSKQGILKRDSNDPLWTGPEPGYNSLPASRPFLRKFLQ